jgi:hypothetical protein
VQSRKLELATFGGDEDVGVDYDSHAFAGSVA